MVERRVCIKCDSEKTYIYNNSEKWHFVDGKRFCHGCYYKIFVMHRRLRYKEKRLTFKFGIRLGICRILNCFEDHTEMHHTFYIPCFPTAGMIELCKGHHAEETRRQGDSDNDYRFDKPTRSYNEIMILIQNSKTT